MVGTIIVATFLGCAVVTHWLLHIPIHIVFFLFSFWRFRKFVIVFSL